MNDINSLFKDKALLNMLPQDGKVVAGVSGGADSMALLHFVMQTISKDRIICAHLNHMIRGEEADRDESFVREFCDDNGIECKVLREDIPKMSAESKIGTEECGRKVRYGFFHSLAKGENDRILTAHNADDNAETVIMNLAKGTGVDGMCGIPKKRGKILRPLLNISMAEIE